MPKTNTHRRSFLKTIAASGAAEFDVKKPDGTPDTTQLSRKGSQAFGKMVAQALAEAIPELASRMKK